MTCFYLHTSRERISGIGGDAFSEDYICDLRKNSNYKTKQEIYEYLAAISFGAFSSPSENECHCHFKRKVIELNKCKYYESNDSKDNKDSKGGTSLLSNLPDWVHKK